MSDPHDKSRNLRDARLHQALTHAPDNAAKPQPATRESIHAMAKAVLQSKGYPSTRQPRTPVPPLPWWKSLWNSMGARSGPWNAALATVLLGGIITLLWHDQSVPTAELDHVPTTQAQTPAAVPAPAAPAPGMPSTREAGMTPSVPSAAPAAAKAPALPAPELAVESAKKAAPPAGEKDNNTAAFRAPKAMQEPARQETSRAKEELRSSVGLAQDKAVADAAAPVPAHAPAPVTAPDAAGATAALPAAPPAAMLPAQRSLAKGSVSNLESAPRPLQTPEGATSFLGNWTSATVVQNGSVANVARARAQGLVNRTIALANSSSGSATSDFQTNNAPGTTVPENPPLVRLELRDAAGATVATFELWGTVWRWQRTGQPDRAGSIDAATAQGLLAESRRLLPS